MARSSPRLHAVVMAGGAGERFWPKSRRSRPKPLLRVARGETLIEATLARAARFAPAGRRWLVCTAENAPGLRAATGLPAEHVLVEPRGRDTAMAAGFAAARIAAVDPEAVLVMLPADHMIPDTRAFADAVRRAARAAWRGGALLTLGVAPTRPDTGFGYLQVGDPADARFPGVCRVRRFVEKPSLAVARRFLRRGDFLWNAGVFVWPARLLLEEIEACEPALAAALAPLRGARDPSRVAVRRAYDAAPALPIDVAVLERSRRVWTLPVRFAWSDVGTWASLAAEIGVGPGRSHVLDGEAVLEDSGGNFVWGGDRLVALVGVEGLAVIDAGDAVLVARLDRSADVRRVVRRLRERGRSDLL